MPEKLSYKDVVDFLISAVLLGVLLWWQGCFPFDGTLDRIAGKQSVEQAAPEQHEQPVLQPTPQPQQKAALPASYEEIAKACVVLCEGYGKAPIGSGVFVGLKDAPDKDTSRVFLITAAHVANVIAKQGSTNKVTVLLHRPNEATDLRKTIYPDRAGWIWPGGLNDIAMMDVTGAFNRSIAEGLDVKYIWASALPFDEVPAHAVRGAFTVRKGDFEKYRIGLGTDVRALGMATELWHSNTGKDRVRQPLALRAGVISTRHDTTLIAGASDGTFVIDARLAPGFSGGPVFATVKHGYLEYPALTGICLGVIRGLRHDQDDKPGTLDDAIQSSYGLVTPLDSMFPSGK